MYIIDISHSLKDSDVDFRVFHDESQSRFFEDTGDIRCGNWQNLRLDNILTRHKAEGHIKGDEFPTDYISISTSPRRTWNYLLRNRKKNARNQEVALIDLRVLKRIGIALGSCTEDLGFEYYNSNLGSGTIFATRQHFLVLS